jgi:hypothetical protein
MEPPQPQQLYYRELIFVDLAPNAVNFADDLIQGHRVQVPIAIDDLNTFFQWSRPAGQDRPVGFIKSLSEFEACLLTSLSDGFLDLDAVSTGLSYTTGTLVNDTNVSNSMNDIVMCYILYMVYGKSSFDTNGKLFNTADAFQMVENSTVATAIGASISNNNERGQSIDDMFRELLKTDPTRFFDTKGHQISGLFEVNTDEAASGSWLFTPGDCIEIKLQFTFQEPVTRRVVSANQQSLTNQEIVFQEQAVEQIIIPKDATFAIRLQLLATAERSPSRIYQLEHSGSIDFLPTPPTMVTLSQTTKAGELAISYLSGNSHGLPILGSHIYVYDSNGQQLYTVFDTTKLTGLEQKPYSITVAQRNSIGEGQVSEPSNTCTPITTVADPPTSLYLSQTLNGGELEANWTPPSYTGGGELKGYHIQLFDSQTRLVQENMNRTPPVLFQNLLASESYRIQVATQNSVGDSLWSPISSYVSPLGTVPSEPLSLSLLTSSTAGELLASWTTPLGTGGSPIAYYTVYLFVDQISTPIQTQSTTNTFLVFSNGLVNTSMYSVYVTATNSIGEGPPSLLSSSIAPA